MWHVYEARTVITVVVMMCHILGAISQPICHEVIATKQEMSMQQCQMSQVSIIKWKMQDAIYQDEEWHIGGFKCMPGDYQPQDAI
jgi:hypothetical protein